MFIVHHRRFFFWLTGLILLGSIVAIIAYGLPLGIDFKGGSLMQVSYPDGRPSIEEIQKQVTTIPTGAVSVRASGENAVNIRTNALTPEEHTAILNALSQSGTTTELAFTSVGPSLGSQFTNKALWALLAVAFAIILYIAFAFRKISRPVPSWGYGLTVVLMLAIDIIVPAGFFAAYAHVTGAEVDSLFVVALLALLGYCVNDVIVIFDRVREHLHQNEKTGLREEFEVTVGKSIDETIVRSVNTSLTTALALVALVFFGPEATRNFSIVMLVGVVIGTFSSICRSAPLLIPLAKWFSKR
jgi:preprotein translocase subunit SecF